jgi:hypothetical protein
MAMAMAKVIAGAMVLVMDLVLAMATQTALEKRNDIRR